MYPLTHWCQSPTRRTSNPTLSNQHLQVCATMHSVEQPTLEDFCRPKKHTSYHFTRSVPGMKSLLPLMLLSPTLPEINGWPSSTPNNRSTFGMNGIPADEDKAGNSRGHFEGEHDLESRLGDPRLKPYRDIPIYSRPRSPLLSRAYSTDDELHSSCSTSESDEWFEVTDCNAVEMETSGCLAGVSRTEIIGSESTIDRDSGLSFQCSGEDPLFSNEAAWLRSPLSYNHPRKLSKMALRGPFERDVGSWLSDTSSCGGDDVLSRAFPLAPAKAHVIDINVNRPSRRSIKVPPRSSSLAGTNTIPVDFHDCRDSWLYEAYSPPATPKPWIGVHDATTKQVRRQFDHYMPRRCLDLAMPSPPVSPTTEWTADLNAQPVLKTPNHAEPEHRAHTGGPPTRNADQAGLSIESINDILIALESLTSHCLNTTLMPDTPCILAIRSQLAQPSTGHLQWKSPLFHNQYHPPPNAIRRKITNFSKPRRSPSSSTSKSCPAARNPQVIITQDFRLPYPKPEISLPPPDMEPLHRIFPKSSKFMRSSLYAYLLANIFVTSLTTPDQAPRSRKKRRDTPYWSTSDIPWKAANLLGMSGLGITSDGHALDNGGDLSTRISRLAEVLRKSIAALISDMDPDNSQEESMGFNAELGSLFIKSLEEVVRSCEMNSYGYF